MQGTLAARTITKRHGPTLVLERVSLAVTPGSRTGVVGPNGIGKTTLLRILAGLEQPDEGAVVRAPATLTVGYLPQEADVRPGEAILEYLARLTGVAQAELALQDLAHRLEDAPQLANDYSVALERFLDLGGGDFEARAAEMCADVGLQRSLVHYSGGEAARASLAAVLLARFDVFLLDEPTNNLDFDGLERLEAFLGTLRGGAVVVSHDRAFLDRVSTRIVELDERTREAREYAGGCPGTQEEEDERRPQGVREEARSARAGRKAVRALATPARAGGRKTWGRRRRSARAGRRRARRVQARADRPDRRTRRPGRRARPERERQDHAPARPDRRASARLGAPLARPRRDRRPAAPGTRPVRGQRAAPQRFPRRHGPRARTGQNTPGTVLLVTHDRRFLERFRATQTIRL